MNHEIIERLAVSVGCLVQQLQPRETYADPREYTDRLLEISVMAEALKAEAQGALQNALFQRGVDRLAADTAVGPTGEGEV